MAASSRRTTATATATAGDGDGGGDAVAVDGDGHGGDGDGHGGDGDGGRACFTPWSMRQPSPDTRTHQQDISCIVCFETQGTAEIDWHGCRTCSAAWCDGCMAQMHDAARDHEEDEVELSCPQCRGSIAGMQLQGRLGRITAADGLGCTEEQAHEVVAYENLLSELVHLCECDESGLPYFTMPAATVARVMARDEICEIVDVVQGAGAGTRLRRMMRAEDYAAAFALVLQGCAAVLRAASSVPRASGLVSEILQGVVADLRAMVRGGDVRLTKMVADAAPVLEALEAERAAECAAGSTGAKVKVRKPRGRRAQRDQAGATTTAVDDHSLVALWSSDQAPQAPQARASARGVRKAPRRHLS